MAYIIIIGILVLIALWVISTYNSFITLRERVGNAKGQITTQLESRWDAVKTLIDATKKYSEHEAGTLENVTEARASLGSSATVSELEEDAEQLNSVVSRLIAVSESYPDLKASETYKTTMESINEYEENVRQSRMIYNDTVARYNRKIRVIPSNIVANLFNFRPREYFRGTESKRDMPTWD